MISIQTKKEFSPSIKDEILKLMRKNAVLKVYKNGSKTKFNNLMLEIKTHRLKLYSENQNLCFDIFFNIIRTFTCVKKGFLSKYIYKIRIEHKNGEIYEIKDNNSEEFKKEYFLFQQSFDEMKWQKTFIIDSNITLPSQVTQQYNQQNSNLREKFSKKREQLNEKQQKTKVLMNNVEDVFIYFEELDSLFSYFKHSDKQQNESSAVDELMKNLGNHNLVSKKDSFSNFHFQLSKEISLIFTDYLYKHYYIISLIDAYKEYNTLRGTDLITPKDFIQGCKNLQNINSKVNLYQLDNGVMILCFSKLKRRFYEQRLL